MMWRKGSAVGLMLAISAALGCGPRARGGDPTPPSPQAVAPLSRAMLGSSMQGGLADSEALDRLFEAPEVAAAGERLFARLRDDPSLGPLYERTLAELMGQPALIEAFARMAAAAPGRSVDELTAEAVTRLSAGMDGPAFDAALDASLDRLFDRPEPDAAFGRMADVLLERSALVERFTALLMQWQPELEAAVGVPMTDERFEARLEQHLSDAARQEALSRLLGSRLADDPGVRQSLAALVDDDAFASACATLVRGLLESPGFHASAIAVLTGLIDEVDAQELGRRVDRVLVTPALEHAVAAWVDGVIAAPSFTALSERLGTVLDDPNVQAELLTIVAGTPAGRTA